MMKKRHINLTNVQEKASEEESLKYRAIKL